MNTVVTGHDTYGLTKADVPLDAIASRDHQAVIRLTLNTPGKKTEMPQYLIDAGTDTSRCPIAVMKVHDMDYYDDSPGQATLEETNWYFISRLKKQGEENTRQRAPTGGELTHTKATSATMDYALQGTHTSVTYNQVKAAVVVEVKNTGVAPFYATRPLEVILVDENNEIVTIQTIESALPSILPDQTGKVTMRLPLSEKLRSNDFAQKLTVVIRTENPLPNGAPVAFANKAMNKPLLGYLELGKLTRGRAPKN